MERRTLRVAKRVALLINAQVAPRRRMLEGVARYVQEHGPWNLYLKPRGIGAFLADWRRNWDGEGVIAAIAPEEREDVLPGGIPVVDLVGGIEGAPLVHTNDASVGRLAADHLLERGYRNFGFVGYDPDWSRNRQQGFAARVREFGCAGEVSVLLVHHSPSTGPASWEEQQQRFVDWVRSLPKPVGVMTATDMLGQQFLEACSRADVAVPEQVAVIGVDNDELMCNVANPPLSSVIINDRQRGYEAARLLDAMMNGEPAPAGPTWIEPAGIVSRASTDMLAIDDQAVAAALRFIRKHACDGIGVDEVTEQLPLSRSMLERRFRKGTGRSINDEIVRVRLERAIELLTATELEVKTIARRAGFRTATYMGSVFRARLGRSPGSYRAGATRE